MPIAYCLLPIAYCLLPIAYCLLPIAYCLLPTAYCLSFHLLLNEPCYQFGEAPAVGEGHFWDNAGGR